MPSTPAVADTSVIVTAALEGNVGHDACVEALLTSGARAAGHAWVEAIAVLTRLPAELRVSAHEAHRVLGTAVAGVRWLSSADQKAFQRWLAGSDVTGGAVYDALVGWVARVAACPLVTRDQRALPTYRQLDIDVLLIAPELSG